MQRRAPRRTRAEARQPRQQLDQQLDLRGHADADHVAASGALDHDVAKLLLHFLHFRLKLGGLLHHAEKISHEWSFSSSQRSSSSVASSSAGIAAGGSGARRRTLTACVPGKSVIAACTRGSACTFSVSLSLRSCACARSVGWPSSLETTTAQRRPVHCSSLRCKSLPTERAALRSS